MFLKHGGGIFSALEKLSEDVEEEGEGTMHFMVNVVQPQFNLHSEDAHVMNPSLPHLL